MHSPVFAGGQGAAFRQRWLDSVFRHCHFIRGHLSRHSSANNHLLGELAGLFIASMTWPCWKECSAWRNDAREQFENEALLQNTPDGVNREQAIWYQHEVMDMMLLALLHGKANGVSFSGAYTQRLEAMMEFICCAMDVGGNVPAMGDGDDAVMVRFDRSPDFNPFHSLLATGAVIFGRPDFARRARRFDDKSHWLLGDAGKTAFERLAAPLTPAPLPRGEREEMRRAFPEGGYWILGSDFESENEIRLVADAGPLGYLSIAAHGHADALAFTLSVAGIPLLIDPGTYSYHAEPPWRDYFRGTAAHNTVRVDGLDQSVPSGKFLWLRHARARCMNWNSTPDLDTWEAEHDGYRRLADPVTHRRRIELDKQARRIAVTDELVCSGQHHIEMFWHFNDLWHVEDSDHSFVASHENLAARIEPDAAMKCELVVGDTRRPVGWLSRGYGEKTPCPTLITRCDIKGQIQFTTVFALTGTSGT